MQKYSLSNTFGCFLSASEKLSPPSTRVHTSRITSRITLFEVCSAKACKLCTIANPASIIVAN